jgi:hypothetical protein
MASELSPETLAMLKARAGQGVSNEAALLTRLKVRLLQNTSKLPKHGRGSAGQWCLPDESMTCVASMRVVPAIVYGAYVEKTPDDKFAGREYFALPPGVEREDWVWRVPGGNFLEYTGRLAGIFDDLEGEADFAKTASKALRSFNSEAKSRTKKLGLPLAATAWRFGATERTNERGQPYWGPTHTYIAAAGEDGGPSEADIMKALAIADTVEAAIAEAMKEANERASRAIESRPVNRIEYSTGKGAKAAVGPDDDIPF